MSELPPPIVAKWWPPPHWSTWHPSADTVEYMYEYVDLTPPPRRRRWWHRYPSVTDEP